MSGMRTSLGTGRSVPRGSMVRFWLNDQILLRTTRDPKPNIFLLSNSTVRPANGTGEYRTHQPLNP